MYVRTYACICVSVRVRVGVCVCVRARVRVSIFVLLSPCLPGFYMHTVTYKYLAPARERIPSHSCCCDTVEP